MKTIVISLGGSIIVPNEIDIRFLKNFKKMIIEFIEKGNKAIIVCGGGKICRKYLDAAKAVSKIKNTDLDKLGIKVTELNAELLKVIFGDYAYERVHSDYNKKIGFEKLLFSAGFLPGTSTDFDAVMFAKVYGADSVINISNIDYVYDKDPKKDKDAKPIKEISWKDFKEIVGGEWKAGLNIPFDPIASKKAEEFGIKVIILNGNDLNNLKNCLDGKEFKGTVIK